MILLLEVYGALCATQCFTINGVKADSDDFGDQYDADPEDAEDYACGRMTFFPKSASQEVLDKYGITEAEYQEVAAKLEDMLSFGRCWWCA